jgi:NCAIR mutase (PurE)-related protein
MYEAVKSILPDVVHYPMARIISLQKKKPAIPESLIAVITAGTSDMPVAEEAAITAELLGNKVLRIYDAGVAGIHRLVDKLPEIRRCRVVIVIAGMEGALASVVGGLVDKPVIAVPTSVGYGANFGGISALLAMLTSCSTGVTVVNIDNGFGAGFSASMINKME